MKLVIATPLYPPEIGGPATYTAELERELPKHGWEVEVVPFVAVRHYPPVVRHAVYVWKVFHRARDAAAVLVQDTVSCGLPALIASKLARRPLLVRVPGDYAWEQGTQRFGVTDGIDVFQHKRYGLRVELLRNIQRLVVRHAKYVIVPSDYFRTVVAYWGVSENIVRTIYNGIEYPLPIAGLTEFLPSPFMVSAGRLVPWKGFAILLMLLKEMPKWHLAIIGEGPDRERLVKYADELGVTQRVRFLGSVPRSEWVSWCTHADAFILNTSFESFSFQVVEAMVCGTPVITTNIGSLPELIHNGREGLLVSPDDMPALMQALISIEQEPEEWRKRVTAAKQTAERFSIQRTTISLLALLEGLVRKQ